MMLALVIAAILIIEVGRRSTLVSRALVAKVQDATGLLVAVGDVHVGWDGTTVLEDLSFTRPLSAGPDLTVERLVVEHEPLVWVILKRGTRIRSAQVQKPTIFVREEPDGLEPPPGWSLTELLDRVRASLPAGDDRAPPPTIPEITIVDGAVQLAPAEGDPLRLALTGALVSLNDLAMTFSLTVEDLLALEGQAALAGDWKHEVRARIDPAEPAWAQVRRVLHLSGIDRPAGEIRWAGRLSRDGLVGTAQTEAVRAGDIAIDGAVRVLAAESLRLHPADLRVVVGDAPPLLVRSGEIVLRDGSAEFASLAMVAGEQVIAADGNLDTRTLSGRADVAFRGRAGDALTHVGNATVEVRTPAGRPVIVATASLRAETTGGVLAAETRLRADGTGWRDLEGTLEFPSLRYQAGEQAWDLSGLTLGAGVEPEGVRLQGVDIPHASHSLVRGDLRFGSLEWSLDAMVSRWRPIEQGPQFNLVAAGRGRAGAVEEFTLDAEEEGVRLTARGSFDPVKPKPLALSLEAVVSRNPAQTDTSSRDPDDRAPVSLVPASLVGDVTADFTLEGTLAPVSLDGRARMVTHGVRFREVSFQDMELLGTAAFHEGGGTFSSEEFALLEGSARVTARTDWRGNVEARAILDRIHLAPLSLLLGLDAPVEGWGGATIDATIPGGELGAMTARAEWRLHDVETRGLGAERVEGNARYGDRLVVLEQLTLANGDGELRARATLPIDDLARIDAAAEADAFALEFGTFVAAISGRARGRLDLPALAGEVAIDGAADVTFDDEAVATIRTSGRLDGRTVELESINGLVGDGDLTGVAVVPLDAPAEATARLTLRDLDPASFSALLPRVADAQGRVNGTLVLAPTTEKHAPEPSRLDIDVTVGEGAWRTVALKSLKVEAYLGERRAVLQSALAEIGDGAITLWGSTNDHDGDRYIQLSGDVRAVDLRQIVSAFTPEAERYEGRVSATFGGAGYLHQPHRLFGSATVAVSESDLIDVPLVNNLYALFHAQSTTERAGFGIAEMRLEGQTLHIPRADYLNRGVEIRASLDMLDVFAGPRSPIAGMAVGTARPLAGSEIPLTAGADRMLSAAQAGGTVARIGGTLSEPETSVVPLADLQKFLSRLFGF